MVAATLKKKKTNQINSWCQSHIRSAEATKLFDEVLRVLDSCQLTAKHKVATPVNWQPGDDVIIVPAVSDDEARQKYPDGWKTPKPYIRIVPQPQD